MFRILFSVLLPFSIPFLIYAVKRRFVKTADAYPLKTLTAAGLGCVFAFLFFFSEPGKAPADSVYTPPKFVNGQIVPAHMDQASDASE